MTHRAAIAQEDLQRGYWDDFKELRDTGGKMFASPDCLTAADDASAFPGCKACSQLTGNPCCASKPLLGSSACQGLIGPARLLWAASEIRVQSVGRISCWPATTSRSLNASLLPCAAHESAG